MGRAVTVQRLQIGSREEICQECSVPGGDRLGSFVDKISIVTTVLPIMVPTTLPTRSASRSARGG